MAYTPADGRRDPKAEARKALFGAGRPAKPPQRPARAMSARETVTSKAMSGLRSAMGGRGR